MLPTRVARQFSAARNANVFQSRFQQKLFDLIALFDRKQRWIWLGQSRRAMFALTLRKFLANFLRQLPNFRMGNFVCELYWKDAPKTCMNFAELARREYYNGIIFHRIICKFWKTSYRVWLIFLESNVSSKTLNTMEFFS